MPSFHVLEDAELPWVHYPPLSVTEPYWAQVPLVKWSNGEVHVVRGDLPVPVTAVRVAEVALADGLGDGTYGVLINPLSQFVLVAVGECPWQD